MLSNAITIRKAVPEDAAKIVFGLASLAQDLGYAHHFHGTVESVIKHGFTEPVQFQVAIAETATEFAGLAVYFAYYSTMRSQPGVYIQDLWVAKDFRQRQLGKRMLRQVGQQARASWDAQFMILAAHNDNAAAQRFYQRLGFTSQYEDQTIEPKGLAQLLQEVATDVG